MTEQEPRRISERTKACISKLVNLVYGILLLRCLISNPVIWAIAFIFIFVKTVHATTIVCILKDSTITIGADSKATKTNFIDATSMLNCKIFQIDSFFVAFSGISHYNKTLFSLPIIAQNTLLATNSIEARISSFQDSLYLGFSKAMRSLYTDNPDFFLDDHNVEKLRCSVLVMGVQDSVPFVYSIQYKIVNEGGDSTFLFTIDKKRIGHSSSATGIIFLGERDHIYEFEESDSTYWKRNNPIDVINFFIELEIRNTPNVGPPVDILQIDSQGGHWIQRKTSCYKCDY